MRTAAIILAILGGLLWGYLAVTNVEIAYRLVTIEKEPMGQYVTFVVVPLLGLTASFIIGPILSKRGEHVGALILTTLSFAIGLFFAFIEMAARAG